MPFTHFRSIVALLAILPVLLAGPSFAKENRNERFGFSIAGGDARSSEGHIETGVPQKGLRVAGTWTGGKTLVMARAVYLARPVSASRFVDEFFSFGFLLGPRVSIGSLVHIYGAAGLGIARGRYSHSDSYDGASWFVDGPYWSWYRVDKFTAVSLPLEFGISITPVRWLGVGWSFFKDANFRNAFGGNGLMLDFSFNAPPARPRPQEPKRDEW